MVSPQKLSHDVAPNSPMGSSDIPTALAYKLGELVNGLAANTEIVSKLVESFGKLELSNGDMKKDFENLSKGLANANADIIIIKTSLLSLGMDDDTKKDMIYLRQTRIARDERKPIITLALGGAVAAAIIAVGAWTWISLVNQTKADFNKPSVEQKSK